MIPKRYETLVFAFIMSLFMSFLMSGVITYLNLGVVSGFLGLWLHAFFKAFLIAFPCVLIVVPTVRRIVRKLVTEG